MSSITTAEPSDPAAERCRRTPEQLRRRADELRAEARAEIDTAMAIILYRAAQAFEEAGEFMLLENRQLQDR